MFTQAIRPPKYNVHNNIAKATDCRPVEPPNGRELFQNERLPPSRRNDCTCPRTGACLVGLSVGTSRRRAAPPGQTVGFSARPSELANERTNVAIPTVRSPRRHSRASPSCVSSACVLEPNPHAFQAKPSEFIILTVTLVIIIMIKNDNDYGSGRAWSHSWLILSKFAHSLTHSLTHSPLDLIARSLARSFAAIERAKSTRPEFRRCGHGLPIADWPTELRKGESDCLL